MQGNPQVIEYFKNLLRGELAARDQYFIHSRIYEDQGLVKMYTRLDHEMQEETQHADALLRRILFLGGMPDMRPNPFTPGTTVVEMLQKDLAVEYEVRETLESGLLFGRRTLEGLGATEDEAYEIGEDIRRRDEERLRLQAQEGILAGRELIHQRPVKPEPLIKPKKPIQTVEAEEEVPAA